jgi:hypothetical protein
MLRRAVYDPATDLRPVMVIRFERGFCRVLDAQYTPTAAGSPARCTRSWRSSDAARCSSAASGPTSGLTASSSSARYFRADTDRARRPGCRRAIPARGDGRECRRHRPSTSARRARWNPPRSITRAAVHQGGDLGLGARGHRDRQVPRARAVEKLSARTQCIALVERWHTEATAPIKRRIVRRSVRGASSRPHARPGAARFAGSACARDNPGRGWVSSQLLSAAVHVLHMQLRLK